MFGVGHVCLNDRLMQLVCFSHFRWASLAMLATLAENALLSVSVVTVLRYLNLNWNTEI